MGEQAARQKVMLAKAPQCYSAAKTRERAEQRVRTVRSKRQQISRRDLLTEVSDKTGFSQAAITTIADTLFATICEHVLASHRVIYQGFGSWDLRTRKARLGRNPRTGEHMMIAPHASIGFTVSRAMAAKAKDRMSDTKTRS